MPLHQEPGEQSLWEQTPAGHQAQGPDARSDLREGGLPAEEAEERMEQFW